MFYDIFVQLCKQKDISPSKAAVEAGFSKSLVTKWKDNNIETPSPDVATKISKYFGVPLSEIYGEQKEAPTSKREREIGFDDFTYAMYNESKELTEDDKEKLLAMARFLAHEQDKKKNK